MFKIKLMTNLGKGSLSQFLVNKLPSVAAFVIFPFRMISTWSLSTSVLAFA